mmetsp:Transcript_27402/g.26481  ORF Transcript_27402/g.26481 Transcript_27402/m.26481 type:complete len:109 (-) Transcript_27402:503-829(-)
MRTHVIDEDSFDQVTDYFELVEERKDLESQFSTKIKEEYNTQMNQKVLEVSRDKKANKTNNNKRLFQGQLSSYCEKPALNKSGVYINPEKHSTKNQRITETFMIYNRN